MKRLALAMLILAACDERAAEAPPATELTEEALGHFCMMRLVDHGGPKAQIHLEGLPDPIFFAQVRDAVAYTQFPERIARITAFYVNDMAKAKSWEEPGASNWIPAKDAYFVVGGNVKGGMGAPELVPFGTETAASEFASEKGGEVAQLGDIPREAVVGPVELTADSEVN